MRSNGTLAKWNDDRGFGFITLDEGGDEIFIHISAFPKDGTRPRIGESLSFEIQSDGKGRKQARHVFCPERTSRPRAPVNRGTSHVRQSHRSSLLGRIIPLLALAALAVYGYREFRGATFSQPEPLSAPDTNVRPLVRTASSYSCDGRTHCSQMRSCAEATFFLRNCPNVKMDGDNDGVPCERQWC